MLTQSPQAANTQLPATDSLAPNLLVVGAMKASSTTFYELITRHPDVWFASEKEPHYFTSPEYGQEAAWQKYLQFFANAPTSARYRGEASTGYTKLPHFGSTPSRIRESLGSPKMIYLIRDPVERSISNFKHSYLAGHYCEGTTLGEAIEADPILLDASCYARQIEAYWQEFGREQLLIIPTDQLHSETASVMRRVETFLELPAYDGWNQPLAASNSQQSLGGTMALQSKLPRPLLSMLRKLIPAGLRGSLKSRLAPPRQVPPVSPQDRQLVFERLADDLQQLLTLADDSLLPWLQKWPSVEQLRGG